MFKAILTFIGLLLLSTPTLFAQSWVEFMEPELAIVNFEHRITDQNDQRIMKKIATVLAYADDIKTPNSNGDDFLLYCIKNGFWRDLGQIAKAGFSTSKKDAQGQIPLHHLIKVWLSKLDIANKKANSSDLDDFFTLGHSLPISEAELLAQDNEGKSPLSIWIKGLVLKKDLSLFWNKGEWIISYSSWGDSHNLLSNDDSESTSFLNLPNLITDYSKPIQIDRDHKMSLFDYVVELISNPKEPMPDLQTIKLLLTFNFCRKSPAKYKDKLFEDVVFPFVLGSSIGEYPNSAALKKADPSLTLTSLHKAFTDPNSKLSPESKTKILRFTGLLDYWKERYAVKEPTPQMYDTARKLLVATNFSYNSKVIAQSAKNVVLSGDAAGLNRQYLIAGSPNIVQFANKLSLPIVSKEGQFAPSSYAIDYLRQLTAFGPRTSSTNSILLGIKNPFYSPTNPSVSKFFIQIPLSLEVISFESKTTPLYLANFGSHYLIYFEDHMIVDGKTYEPNSTEGGIFLNSDGEFVTWSTDASNKQSLSIGKSKIDGVQVVFANRSIVAYVKDQKLVLLTVNQKIIGLSGVLSSFFDKEQNLVAIAIQGTETIEVKEFDPKKSAAADQSKPSKNTPYPKTRIVDVIAFEYEMSEPFDDVVVSSDIGSLVYRAGGELVLYDGTHSRVLLYNKKLGLYFIPTTMSFMEAKTGAIYRGHGSNTFLSQNLLSQDDKVIELKTSDPDWEVVQ